MRRTGWNRLDLMYRHFGEHCDIFKKNHRKLVEMRLSPKVAAEDPAVTLPGQLVAELLNQVKALLGNPFKSAAT